MMLTVELCALLEERDKEKLLSTKLIDGRAMLTTLTTSADKQRCADPSATADTC